MFLVAAKVVEMDSPSALIESLGLYMLTVLSGLAIHGFIILPLLYFITTRKNPFGFIIGILQALMTALATASR